jgi:hypothetical protein
MVLKFISQYLSTGPASANESNVTPFSPKTGSGSAGDLVRQWFLG